MEYLVVLALPIVAGVVIYLVYKQYSGKNYYQKTDKLAESIQDITLDGFTRNEHGYVGKYKAYHVNIYPTTSPAGNWQNRANHATAGPMFQVWVSIAPQVGQLKGLGGFFGKYMVIGEQPGYAMIGFTVRSVSGANQSSELLEKLDKLIVDLNANGVMPYLV
jgi:hypothetical protein